MLESLTLRRKLLLLLPLVFTLPLGGCGSSARAVRIEVTEKGNGPVPDAEISVIRGSVRRDPLEVIFVTDEQGSVIVDSLAKESVEITVVAGDARYSSKTTTVPSGFDDKKPFPVELELMQVPTADTTRGGNSQDIRIFRE
jgi:hypothetical protein